MKMHSSRTSTYSVISCSYLVFISLSVPIALSLSERAKSLASLRFLHRIKSIYIKNHDEGMKTEALNAYDKKKGIQ